MSSLYFYETGNGVPAKLRRGIFPCCLSALFLAMTLALLGCGWTQNNSGKLKDMVRIVEKKAAQDPQWLSTVYTLRNELDCVRKKKFQENLKRDLETRGSEGRAQYENSLKSALGDAMYQELLRIREKEGYADLFH